jgi:hypothetical protein
MAMSKYINGQTLVHHTEGGRERVTFLRYSDGRKKIGAWVLNPHQKMIYVLLTQLRTLNEGE